MTSLPAQLADIAWRLRRSLRMNRNDEPFFLEQDEIAHDLETLARQAEGQAVEMQQ